ncbi:MAG: ASCH domain-containing protein [Terriglobales bacterium]
MKCLSIRQPWAHAIFALGKDVENRSWPTRYRGPLLIHTARRIEAVPCQQLGVQPAALLTGCCIGVVELVDCVRESTSPWAIAGQWHWILRSPHLLSEPMALAGQLGLFEVSLAAAAGA